MPHTKASAITSAPSPGFPPSPPAFSAPTPSPVTQAIQPDLEPKPLVLLSGQPVTRSQNNPIYQLTTPKGIMLVTLVPELAPQAFKRAIILIRQNAYTDGTLAYTQGGFLILHPKAKATGLPSTEKNLAKQDIGQLYFDGNSLLGVTLLPQAKVPTGWVCLGLAYVEGDLRTAWMDKDPEALKIESFGNRPY